MNAADQSQPMSRFDLQSSKARVVVFKSGTAGLPLLLVHSINAAASVAEMEPLRVYYSKTRQVFCMDLPGFGQSDRSDRPYTARLMTDAVTEVAREIARQTGRSIDALAVSLSSEYLARAAVENPSLFRSVALVSPTAFSGTRSFRAAPGQSRGKLWLYKLLRGPGWGAGLYNLLTRPKVIRYFLQRTWGSKNIDEGLWRADLLVSRSPGAHFAPLYFLSAILFSADIHAIYDRIRQPVWVSHGTRGDFVDYKQLPAFADRNSWAVTVFDTGAMPYFEILSEFTQAYDAFLSRLQP